MKREYAGEATPVLPGSRTFKLSLAYDGTAFKGWQRQSGKARTVQATIEDALASLAGAPVFAVGASRTDSGVHAEAQVASASLPWKGSAAELASALSSRLPDDVQCLLAEDADPRFHARYLAKGKRYRYRLIDGPIGDPFAARFALRVPVALRVDAMAEAARAFEGERDFRAFCNERDKARKSVRSIGAAAVRRAGRLVEMEFSGDSFLRNQARIMSGALIEVGLGRIEPAAIGTWLSGGRRCDAPMAPAKGLCLVEVYYGEH